MLGQIPRPKKLCLLRLSAIGDVCHAVAVVQHIQKHMPETEITWVIGKAEAKLLQGLQGVEFIVFDKSQGFSACKVLYKALSGRKFDVLLHMQAALRASFAAACIKAKVKIGFDIGRAREGQWLVTNKRIDKQNNPHVLDGFMAFAKRLGLPVESPQWQMPVTSFLQQNIKSLIPSTLPFIIICPAASNAERNWHSQGYAQIADKMVAKGFQVVLCSGNSNIEVTLSESIVKLAKCEVINLAGKTDLAQLLAILKEAKLVIAPDTGPAHMAVTVNTPVVGLYAHSNPARTGPYLYQKYVVNVYPQAVKEAYGKDVEQLPWGTRAKGAQWMNLITTENVMEKVNLCLAEQYPEL